MDGQCYSPDVTDARQDMGSGEKVLLVEDNPMVRRSVEATLTNFGYQVVAAETGEEAIELLKGGNVDLLLSDMVLPEMDGKVLVERARLLLPSLPVLFMSGYDLSNSFPRGMVTFLQKPFDAQDLAQAVRQALGRS